MPAPIKQTLGRYYTPEWLAQELVDWALPSGGSLLDPSFGGCAFLEAGLRRQRATPGEPAGESIFGVDIDPGAMKYARSLFQQGVPKQNIVIGNFLSERVFRRLGTYDAVVGNPPYIRHHALTDSLISDAQHLVETFASIPRLSSAWAYFTVLATELVRSGGRMAFILPGALLQTDYGSLVMARIKSRFSSVTFVHILERLFEGTDEESVIVLADQRCDAGTGKSEYSRVSAQQLPDFLDAYKVASGELAENYKSSFLDESVFEAWRSVRTRLAPVNLGQVADIRIGTVTGANSFFIRSADDPILAVRDVTSRNILRRRKHLHVPDFNRAAMDRISRSADPSKLAVITGEGRATSGLRAELIQAKKAGIHNQYHCRHRTPWYTITDLQVPDLFLPYLNGGAPHLTKNGARALCTNAIHRVNVDDKRQIDAIVSSSYGSLFAFECELYGRHYGGSVLKIEPSAAKRLSVHTQVDLLAELVAADNERERHRLADLVFTRKFHVRAKDLQCLQDATARLRDHRSVSRLDFD